MPLPLIHFAAGGIIALGLGIAAYDHREEILEVCEVIKYGLQTAAERQKQRRMGVQNAGYAQNNRYTHQPNVSPDDDDDLYHIPSANDHENDVAQRNEAGDLSEESTTESDAELWDSTRTLTARDGQTSGVYDRKATFRSRKGTRKSPNPQSSYNFSSDDGPSTALSSASSGEETPEDDMFHYEKYLPKKARATNARGL